MTSCTFQSATQNARLIDVVHQPGLVAYPVFPEARLLFRHHAGLASKSSLNNVSIFVSDKFTFAYVNNDLIFDVKHAE